MYVFIALLIGFIAIGLSNMFGIGGAVEATAALRLFLGVSPAIALGTTLPVAIPAAVAGAFTYHRQDLVDLRTAAYCSLGGIFGSVGGAFLTRVINLNYLMILTGLVLLYVSIAIARRGIGPIRVNPAAQEPEPAGHPILLILAIGLTSGLFSGLLGIGGGIVMIPCFLYLLRMPLKKAFGTSLAVIAVIAIPGTIVHSFLHHISWSLALYLVVASIPGAFIGAHITTKARERLLYILFGLLLFAFGVVFIVSEVLILTG
ncbi:MAG: hypothetical protein A2W01_08775 [Candidatus Solincola sediminis]|uniref:Probable membrane transporter protein n=1 Tax=Candidatus Solincola sediminis TaxID=1797199 RepID=A0A1F2WRE3_9ACTN|nr:MAG: hypothetical protein A2Y75_11285 [Candidatus Solincola sediminis]OFW60220.1 MAG: hypothetical protein A2W01_08775 [Candidatus Solincola sediminis]